MFTFAVLADRRGMWKDLTDCNHNKKSLKQLIFYSNSQFFPFYTFLFIYRVIACPRQPFVGTGYFVRYRQVPSGEGIQGA